MIFVIGMIVLGLLAFLAYKENQWKDKERDWAKERQVLITRIQHPEFVVAETEKPAISDEQLLTSEVDDLDLVGTVQLNGDDGE